MLKSLVVLCACSVFIMACSNDSGPSNDLLSTMPVLSDQNEELNLEPAINYNLLYNPDNLSPTEYILAHNITIHISQTILDNDPNFSPDTVFGWNYKVSNQIIPEAGDFMRKVTMTDGEINMGTYDFSALHGKDYISIFADGGIAVTSSWQSDEANSDDTPSDCPCECVE